MRSRQLLPTWGSPGPKPLRDGGECVRVVGVAAKGVDASPEALSVIRVRGCADQVEVSFPFIGVAGEVGAERRCESTVRGGFGEIRTDPQGAVHSGDIGRVDEIPDRVVGVIQVLGDVIGEIHRGYGYQVQQGQEGLAFLVGQADPLKRIVTAWVARHVLVFLQVFGVPSARHERSASC